MLTTETCRLFLGSVSFVQRHNHFLPSRKEMSHHRCLPAPSPATPKPTAPPPPSGEGGGEQPGHSLGCHECHGPECCGEKRWLVTQPPPPPNHPLVLRGAMHRGRSPEKSGSHRKHSLDAVSGSFQLRQLQMRGRSSARAGSLSS